MHAEILRGSKEEIAERVASIPGDVREAIVFVEEGASVSTDSDEDIFAEMESFGANAGGADYSRETLYKRMESE